ncbi:TetR family transcriptional regulator [Pseudonocardia sp. EC080610-09]|uniref:TetR/AcrR family transcriptional regulator n=1 Tax=unclassified Pseudonocardia TaxID=2619320 RepID=UPI0006CB135E|nr:MULTISPECIES: TetR/AcrR family transcriptional regulator [unclassified Pseudonocardia]ALE72988.1 TetR family transcriptional regulator [Pseudonocardia sp. EC080625-04]ALL76317.1 TetR family transcriptional regulator [Pseudonocardia sp. EC080610-09]
MARTKDPAVRTALIERAAHMLRAREPITTRSLVTGAGVSTMAVYTHFGGMDGLWRALRQEGFVRLGATFGRLRTTDDPVHDLAALVAAYADNALEHPDLYRVMFDDSVELEDLRAADATLEYLVQAALRGRTAGRVRADVVPLDLATRSWAVGHGIVSLVANGPLPPAALDHVPPMLAGVVAEAGDDPERARRSVDSAWVGRGR